MNKHSFTYCIRPILYLCKIFSLAPYAFYNTNNTMKEDIIALVWGVPAFIFILTCLREVICLFQTDQYFKTVSLVVQMFMVLLGNVIYLFMVGYNLPIRNRIKHLIFDISKLEINFKCADYFKIQITVLMSIFIIGSFDTHMYYKYIENLTFIVYSGFIFPMYINVLYIVLTCLFLNCSKNIFTKLNGELIQMLQCKNVNFKMNTHKIFRIFEMYCDATDIAQRQNSLFGAPTMVYMTFIFSNCVTQNFFTTKVWVITLLNNAYEMDAIIANFEWFSANILLVLYIIRSWNSTEKEVRLYEN